MIKQSKCNRKKSGHKHFHDCAYCILVWALMLLRKCNVWTSFVCNHYWSRKTTFKAQYFVSHHRCLSSVHVKNCRTGLKNSTVPLLSQTNYIHTFHDHKTIVSSRKCCKVNLNAITPQSVTHTIVILLYCRTSWLLNTTRKY